MLTATILNLQLLLQSMIPVHQQGLSVGDKCPDLFISSIINHPSGSARLSDFKGKLVILDFWSTWCLPCVAALPKMEALQQAFGNRVLILPVTTQQKEMIAAFWKNNRYTRELSIPSVVDDTALSACFPHEGVPHEVWIDGNGIVRGITTEQYVNAANIQRLLNGETVNWPVNSTNYDFRYDAPLLMPADNGPATPGRIYYSAITEYLPSGIRPMAEFSIDSAQRYVRFYALNQPVIGLYKQALKYTDLYGHHNRFIVVTKDSSRFFYDPAKYYYEEWMSRNAYTYEARMPLSATEEVVLNAMRSDLNRYLGLRGRFERRRMHCLRLVTKKSRLLPLRRDNAPLQGKRGVLLFTHTDEMVLSLNLTEGIPPIINETGIDAPLALTLDGSLLKDLPGLRSALQGYGLDLVPAVRELKVFVLSE
ncbi:TlpA disulfide reductase family protein [uncultured Chitinophaga sp.]|jgi:Thiol-disulfide isomerase and thioredoxins|uniref:TlpA family protein disulfide reductase n=1 Tax=uncultured Chitinophaga sp. TaxID=339340 RepID=UPI0026177F74|nr:TlpA disulfide reductase family protein [uncultured Chitinophaga sp.]